MFGVGLKVVFACEPGTEDLSNLYELWALEECSYDLK